MTSFFLLFLFFYSNWALQQAVRYWIFFSCCILFVVVPIPFNSFSLLSIREIALEQDIASLVEKCTVEGHLFPRFSHILGCIAMLQRRSGLLD